MDNGELIITFFLAKPKINNISSYKEEKKTNMMDNNNKEGITTAKK